MSESIIDDNCELAVNLYSISHKCEPVTDRLMVLISLSEFFLLQCAERIKKSRKSPLYNLYGHQWFVNLWNNRPDSDQIKCATYRYELAIGFITAASRILRTE